METYLAIIKEYFSMETYLAIIKRVLFHGNFVNIVKEKKKEHHITYTHYMKHLSKRATSKDMDPKNTELAARCDPALMSLFRSVWSDRKLSMI